MARFQPSQKISAGIWVKPIFSKSNWTQGYVKSITGDTCDILIKDLRDHTISIRGVKLTELAPIQDKIKQQPNQTVGCQFKTLTGIKFNVAIHASKKISELKKELASEMNKSDWNVKPEELLLINDEGKLDPDTSVSKIKFPEEIYVLVQKS